MYLHLPFGDESHYAASHMGFLSSHLDPLVSEGALRLDRLSLYHF